MPGTACTQITLAFVAIFACLQNGSQAAEVAKPASFYKTKTCTGVESCTLPMATMTAKQRLEITQVACRYALRVNPGSEVSLPDTREILLDVKAGAALRAQYPLQPFFAGLTPLAAPNLAYVNVNQQIFVPVGPRQSVSITVALNASGSVHFYGCTIAGQLFTTQ